MSAVDGIITNITSSEMELKLDDGSGLLSMFLRENAAFHLNGLPASKQKVLKVGNLVTVFRQRPQIVEALNIGQPTPGLDGKKYQLSNGQKEAVSYAIIDYDHEGNRRVLRDGFNPYFG